MPEKIDFRAPLISEEQKKRLEASRPRINEAKLALEALEELGVDASDLKDKINWTEQVTNTLLTKFAKK